MIFPELLGGVLAGDSLEDLCAAWVLVYEACVMMSDRSFALLQVSMDRTRKIDLYERQGRGNERGYTSNIIYILINDDIHARAGIFVRCDVCNREGFRHVGSFNW